LRAGFRPAGAYTVSFVFMHSGAPFAKKGDSDISLPKMDVPIGILEWELYLPEQYKVKDFSGDAISASLLPPEYSAYNYARGSFQAGVGVGGVIGSGSGGGNMPMNGRNFTQLRLLRWVRRWLPANLAATSLIPRVPSFPTPAWKSKILPRARPGILPQPPMATGWCSASPPAPTRSRPRLQAFNPLA